MNIREILKSAIVVDVDDYDEIERKRLMLPQPIIDILDDICSHETFWIKSVSDHYVTIEYESRYGGVFIENVLISIFESDNMPKELKIWKLNEKLKDCGTKIDRLEKELKSSQTEYNKICQEIDKLRT